MSVAWFTKAKSKTFRGMKPGSTKPVKPQTKAPSYKSPDQTQKRPKLRKPVVKLPFVKPASKTVTAFSGQDMSESELENLQAMGGIAEIEWIAVPDASCDGLEGNNAAFCGSLDGKTWTSLEQFYGGRKISAAPNGKSVGMYGYSHPGCRCYLSVTLQNGEVEQVGPYS